jgi:hypothetical protein
MMTRIPQRGPTIDETVRPTTGPIRTKLRGEVTDNDDPDKLGRLRVKVKTLTDDKGNWAEPCVPFAGAGLAFFALPPVGTGDWIDCLEGRIDRMVYCGFYWKEGELDGQDYKPERVHFETKSLRLEISDADDEIRIEIKGGGAFSIKGNEVTIEASSITQDASGNKVVLDSMAFDVKNAALKVV